MLNALHEMTQIPCMPWTNTDRCYMQVDVVGVEGELKRVALSMLKTRANFAYTIGEVKQDVRRVFNTGWFKECIPDAQDTRDGVKLVIKVGKIELSHNFFQIQI